MSSLRCQESSVKSKAAIDEEAAGVAQALHVAQMPIVTRSSLLLNPNSSRCPIIQLVCQALHDLHHSSEAVPEVHILLISEILEVSVSVNLLVLVRIDAVTSLVFVEAIRRIEQDGDYGKDICS